MLRELKRDDIAHMEYSQVLFETAVKAHQHWRCRDCPGWETMRADFSGMDLRGIVIRDMDLEGAIFHGTDLGGATIENSTFRKADLTDAKLSSSTIEDTTFDEADMRGMHMNNIRTEGTVTFISANMSNAVIKDSSMEPASEPAASLKKLGVSLPACDLCGHFYEGECGHYEEKVFRCNWGDARDCGHFYSNLPSRVLQYTDTADGELYVEEFALPVILDTGMAFPDAASVVTALRKDPGLSEMLDQVVWGVEDKEDPTKWELAEESPYVF